MTELPPTVRRRSEEVLARLDALPDSRPVQTMKQNLDEALVWLVQMRDDLIEAQRAGHDVSNWLPSVNAILSTLFGTEYPVGGLKVKRIEEAREALRALAL